MFTRDTDASFGTPNVVIARRTIIELTLSFRPLPYLSRLLPMIIPSVCGRPGRTGGAIAGAHCHPWPCTATQLMTGAIVVIVTNMFCTVGTIMISDL